MTDNYKVGYGKPPAKTKFQKGKSGNPSGRPKWMNLPNEPMDPLKVLIAELKSMMTINEAGNKKRVSKLQAVMKAAVAISLHDKGMMKFLLSLIAKIPQETFVGDNVLTYKITQSEWDHLCEKFEEDVATWSANSSEATNNEADVD
jgi:hypothetical protein